MEDAAPSKCSVSVKRHGEDVRVSPHQNDKGQWKLDLYEGVVFPDGFPFEVTLPQFRHLQVLMIVVQKGYGAFQRLSRTWRMSLASGCYSVTWRDFLRLCANSTNGLISSWTGTRRSRKYHRERVAR